ncbi:MAG TPA: hypothetical protein GXZ93_01045 [Actinobacteria bacterium]|nr:hypothetical protein [Actinomycetota bacterium]
MANKASHAIRKSFKDYIIKIFNIQISVRLHHTMMHNNTDQEKTLISVHGGIKIMMVLKCMWDLKSL